MPRLNIQAVAIALAVVAALGLPRAVRARPSPPKEAAVGE